jgi:hypothetical protein
MRILTTLCRACNTVTVVDVDPSVDLATLTCSDRIGHRCHHCQNAFMTPFAECDLVPNERIAA